MNKITIQSNKKEYHVYVRDEADQSVLAEIFKVKEYRAAENILRHAKDPIIDVGAHAGFFSMYARSLNAEVRIIAIEPETSNQEALRRHMNENHLSGIELIDVALAGESGNRGLFVSKDSHNHYLLGKNEAQANLQNVSVLSFSDLLKKCDIQRVGLLKMDIEGGEYEVFEALSATDFQKIGAIIMEYHNTTMRNYKTIEKKLRENGFGVQIYPSKFDRTMGFLFGINKRW
jgi:FkbM family methyltransferase